MHILLPNVATASAEIMLQQFLGRFKPADTVVYVPLNKLFCQPLILHHCKLTNVLVLN